jgi:site-specific DNA-methyltransferase (adenine-specific)
MAMRLAGLEIKDTIYWHYGSGFPKSVNIHKQIEDEQISENWKGFGTALKPASEPIVMARKPLEKGLTISQNLQKWGTGVINIDGCRVGNEKMGGGTNPDFRDVNKKSKENTGKMALSYGQVTNAERIEQEEYFGRFPANLILTHHSECEFLGYKKVKGQKDNPTNRTQFNGTWNEETTGLRKNTNSSKEGYGDENGEETVENWNCHCDCPIKILDNQSGNLKSGKPIGIKSKGNGYHGNYGEIPVSGFGDSGGASRFFYVAKASQSERNRGLKEEINGHPTVKPVKLMQYLVRLVTPPNGICLDPFIGSGTTGIACKLENIDFIGIDITEEYIEISKNRIENWDEKAEYEYLNVETIYEENCEEQTKQNKQLSLF